MYNIRLTRLAKAIATTKYTVEAVEARAREELAELELEDPTNFFMHCFRMPTGVDYEFICFPGRRDGVVVVDTVSYEEGDVLDKGPFEGKRLMIPVPDSSGEIEDLDEDSD